MELTLKDGARVLVSYDTPVAALTANGAALRADRFYSRTTSGHISRFLGDKHLMAQRVEPDALARLIEGA